MTPYTHLTLPRRVNSTPTNRSWKWRYLSIALLLAACAHAPEQKHTEGADGFSLGKPYPVTINGIDQMVMVHTNNESNPVLLVLHGGPGYAMLPLMHKVNPQLEDEFTVANWDQRGAGLSPETNKAHLTLEQLVDDAHKVSLWLMQKFGQQKLYLLGHSFGTVLGDYLVKKYPADYFAFIGIGQTVNVTENEQYGYDWAYGQAQSKGDKAAVDLLDAVGRPDNDGNYPGKVPSEYADQFDAGSDVTMHYVGLYGGDVYGAENADQIDQLIFGSGIYEQDSWTTAWKFSQRIFDDPKVWAFNSKDPSQGFLDFKVPVYFFTGQHDYDTPVNLFEEYYALITSKKSYIQFQDSAHFPFYEQPGKFREELLTVKKDTYP